MSDRFHIVRGRALSLRRTWRGWDVDVETATGFSTLMVQPSSTAGAATTRITTTVSPAGLDRIGRVRQELLRQADEICQGSLLDITASYSTGNGVVGVCNGEGDEEDVQRFGAGNAFRALLAHPQAGRVAEFELPYGSYEHEACSHPSGGGGGALPVTEDLEVEGLPGVYLAGPGNFVRLGAANPALTIIAMSRWLGDSLAA
ncbi:hypothetical protein [Frankia sp. Cas3]|uniref:hypothetical protein n=1 Tax=Frankia sp. Cas3 TaxID=3073926 RepID=UPI002AD2ACCC|nr:hypothetical protein [Frankia sp. Cas3]